MTPAWLVDPRGDGMVLALLLAAHMLGDFVLQTRGLVARKSQPAWMGLHLGILFAVSLALVLPWWPLRGQTVAVLLGLTLAHGAMDRLKLFLETRRSRPLGHFVVDQAIHLILIVLAWRMILPGLPPAAIPAGTVRGVTIAGVAVAAYSFNASGAAFLVAGLLRRHRLEDAAPADGAAATSGERRREEMSRGRTIGILERMLLLSLILIDQWGAIGLIMAAKSIARFKDLDRRDFSEYYLIGTLASVAIALASGLLVRLLV